MTERACVSENLFDVGKATPISDTEQQYVLGKLLDMSTDELKDTLVGLANGKFVEPGKVPV